MINYHTINIAKIHLILDLKLRVPESASRKQLIQSIYRRFQIRRRTTTRLSIVNYN